MAETETTQETETPSIEAIAAEFRLGEESPTPPSETAKSQEAPPPPDPVQDPDGYGKWLVANNQQNAELRTSLDQTLSELNAEKARLSQQREEQELNALVDKVHKEIGDVPRNLVKYALADKYNSNEAFKAIIENRGKAPQALDKAIQALLPELRKDFAIKPDPQIAENQRAMSEGTRGSSAPSEDDADLKLLRSDETTFSHAWERIKHGA